MKVLLIDGLNLVRRIFSAVPGSEDPIHHNRAVVESVLASLRRAVHFHQPSHVVGVFDGEGPSWRHEIFSDYKSQRPPMPSALRRALSTIVSAIEGAGINCLSYPGYEADDLLASIAIKVASRDGDVIILSTDTGLCQMLDSHIEVFDHFADERRDENFVWRRFQVRPSQLVDLLALVGIPSSSIPGIRGVGLKTAGRLIAEFNDLEGVLAAAQEMPGRIGRLLRDGAAHATLSRQLVRLSPDVELGVSLSQFRVIVDWKRDATIVNQTE